jgi:hypothetical protein
MKTYITGSRRFSNIFWALAVTIGGYGFFLTGLSSYFKVNFLLFSNVKELTFIPQGITLLFYGSVGLILGIFLCLTILWDVGSGYNEYNKNLKKVFLYRQGFPGINRTFTLSFSFDEIRSIKVRVKEGLNPVRQLILCLNDKREIPLSGINRPISLSTIENEAVRLAQYLNIYLETE